MLMLIAKFSESYHANSKAPGVEGLQDDIRRTPGGPQVDSSFKLAGNPDLFQAELRVKETNHSCLVSNIPLLVPPPAGCMTHAVMANHDAVPCNAIHVLQAPESTSLPSHASACRTFPSCIKFSVVVSIIARQQRVPTGLQ